MRKMIAAALAVMLVSAPAMASEIQNLTRGIRPLGMGGAFTAIADDENAVFYNPAGLALVDKTDLALINPKIEISQNIINMYNDAKGLNAGDTVGTTNLMQKYIGKPEHLDVDLFPNLTTHNFEIGLFAKAVMDVAVHTPSYPTADLDGMAEAGVLAAFSHSFMDDRLHIGLGGKYLQRSRFVRTLTPADVVNTANNTGDKLKISGDDVMTKSKIGFDLGTIYKLDTPDFNTYVGLSILNVGDVNFGDYSYTPTGGTVVTVPNKIPQTINLGVALNKELGIFNTTFAADYQDLANNASDDKDKAKRLHLGIEAKLPHVLTLRAGLNQGYFTYGLGVDFWIIDLQYAYYKEEIGGYAGQLGDARQVVQLTIGF